MFLVWNPPNRKKNSQRRRFLFFFASNRPTAWASSASSCACPRGEAAGLLSGWTGRGKSRRMYPTYEDLPAEVRKMIFVKRAQFRRERREAAIIIGRNVCFYFLGSRLCRLGRTHHLVQSATPYMRNWARRRCVRNRHSFILDKPYGVVVIYAMSPKASIGAAKPWTRLYCGERLSKDVATL